ncbi:hypothetical protein BH10ACI1_BH10ACI1_16260 [soil metagenome]
MNKKTYLEKILLTISCAVMIAFCAGNISAQINEVSTVNQKARTTIRPKAKPVTKKVDFNKPITITRVEKKSRRNYRRTTTNKRTVQKKIVRKVKVLPLAVQLRLLTVDEAGKETEVDSQTSFTTNTRLRLSLEANQLGYLYVIRQGAQEEDGEIIFPTQLVNNGSNNVAANKEYILPSNCPKDLIQNPIDCSLTLLPFETAPKEYFTIIFTRDLLVDLPNDVRNRRVSLINLMSAGKLKSETLVNLIDDSSEDLVAQQGDTTFAVRIINTNVKDNEEIIETFVINKKQN